MRAQLLTKLHAPLVLSEVPKPIPASNQVLIRVHTCGICRTDLHVIDGDLPEPSLPLIPGHQIVGHIEEIGKDVTGFKIGDRVGVPWLGQSCGKCYYCQNSRENLCDNALYTGYNLNGGFADYCVANFHFIFPLPPNFPDLEIAPLLCAGLIGYRALRMTEDAKKIGFFGFGVSAHILAQVANYQGKEIYAFTRPHDEKGQAFAKKLGVKWVGSSDMMPPTPLDAIIIFAAAGELIPKALRAVRKGGIVISAEIHMSDIPSFPYEILWGERVLRSVANLTRQDGRDFFEIAPKIPIHTTVNAYPLEDVNKALDDLRQGKLTGAAVVVLGKSALPKN